MPISLTKPPHLYYAFTWRYALCHMIRLLRLVSDGGVRRAPAKATNNHFDNVFATFGTYFNGVMSWDADLLATHHNARVVLAGFEARLAADYVESGYILPLLSEQSPVPAGD